MSQVDSAHQSVTAPCRNVTWPSAVAQRALAYILSKASLCTSKTSFSFWQQVTFVAVEHMFCFTGSCPNRCGARRRWQRGAGRAQAITKSFWGDLSSQTLVQRLNKWAENMGLLELSSFLYISYANNTSFRQSAFNGIIQIMNAIKKNARKTVQVSICQISLGKHIEPKF